MFGEMGSLDKLPRFGLFMDFASQIMHLVSYPIIPMRDKGVI